MELEIDENLLRLEHFLLYLDNYSFDDDILEILEKLRRMVDKKLYGPINKKDEDIVFQKLKIVVKLKKFQKK